MRPSNSAVCGAAGSTAAASAITVDSSRDATSRSTPACKPARSTASGTNGPSMSAARIRSCRSDRLPAAAVCSAPAAITTMATGIPRARLIAARAAPERAWYRPRSRSASRGAIGNRDAHPASARIAMGLRSSTPRTTATVPAKMSSALVQSIDVSSTTPPARPRQTTPATTKHRPSLRSDAPASVGAADRRGPTRSGCAPSSGPATTPRPSQPARRAPCPRRPTTTAR